MIEEWKDALGYEGKYQISNLGRVKSLEQTYFTGKDRRIKMHFPESIMKQYENFGYMFVRLSKDGKTKLFRVHRLVALSFLKYNKNKPFINHINGIRNNNELNNIEWCSQKDNVNHAYKIKLNRGRRGRKVACFKEDGNVIKEYNKIIDAVSDGFRHDCIVACCRRKHRIHQGLYWKYID